MRESVLLRILPEGSERAEGRWGDLLVGQFFAPLPDQRESMADRLAVFVEDLQAAAGRIEKIGTAQNAMCEATRMRETGFVVLVDGSTRQDRRERVFAGFNSPLLPEILICTSVGQEGIDLHRHCSRNWLFTWLDEGGKRTGDILSIIATCIAHDVNPRAYLHRVVHCIVHGWPQAKILLPDRILAQDPALCRRP